MKRRKALLSLGLMSLFTPKFLNAKDCEKEKGKKSAVLTEKSPKPIGPYSQAIIANGFIFVSGHIAIDPVTGQLSSGSVEDQTRIVLNCIKGVLEEAGSSMDKVVKCTVFLDDIKDFSAMNSIYSEFFESPFPARAAIEVAQIPRGAKLEIEAIALI